jgi:hypothetical protein
VEVIGNYEANGHALVRGLIPPEVARAFMRGLKDDLGPAAIPVSKFTQHPAVLKRAAFELSGDVYKPMSYFLWALTPAIRDIVGRDLLPTYDYFRIYREGDICRVHSDRPESEHSVSLTLDYSDGEVWDLQVANDRTETLYPLADDFGSEPYSSLAMEVGDAVLYRGSQFAHGRMTPNPNAWSAHLFLNYVDRDGPNGGQAFDGSVNLEKVNFSFA